MTEGPAEPAAAVADWFARRTWGLGDVDIDDLAARKDRQGLSVSVVVPARDEAPTVAGVVEACASLGNTLVDELVVIDGGSGDDTARLAAEAGARVHRDSDLRPDHGPSRGKGDALWRSLSVTSGDVVVFLDADVVNPGPHFVVGLLAPLLHAEPVQLVKAFYERPLELGGQRAASGGGRVTELCARPLLNLFWPALSGLVQPLAGEYAARRELLEALPFFTGYGVELGLLIDTLSHAGGDAIAQVDVHERAHRNQSLDALGRMAHGIMQVAARRLTDEGRLRTDDVPSMLVQFVREQHATRVEARDMVVTERPAVRDLPAGTP